jgi:hypothetical protein
MKSECQNCGLYELYTMITNSIPSDYDALLEFRWSVSSDPDTHGKRTCSLSVDGQEAGSANGNEGDMRAICLSRWFAGAFKSKLRKLKISIKGILDMADVAEVIQECGYQVRFVCSKRDYEVYRLVEISELKEQKKSMPSGKRPSQKLPRVSETDYWSDHLEGMQQEQEDRDEALNRAMSKMKANDAKQPNPMESAEEKYLAAMGKKGLSLE